MMSDMALPLEIEGITAPWLEAALRFRYPELELQGVQIEDVILGTSTKIRVRPGYAPGRNAGLPETLIVKGGFESHSPSMKEMYVNEIRAYRDVLPFIEMNAPACYYVGSDPGSHQSIVIMEDLKPKGAVFLHAQEFGELQPPRARAGLHAGHEPFGDVVRRGQHLVGADLLSVGEEPVGERAADVDVDRIHHAAPIRESGAVSGAISQPLMRSRGSTR